MDQELREVLARIEGKVDALDGKVDRHHDVQMAQFEHLIRRLEGLPEPRRRSA